MAAAMAGDLPSVPYTRSDMPADTVGLLDHLGLDSTHLVGASMGGMIAQTVAVEHPDRVGSLTSMMSSTGDRAVGQATRSCSAPWPAAGRPPTPTSSPI
jgi:pimeloyl-ACP methyl ester carboxylesterase